MKDGTLIAIDVLLPAPEDFDRSKGLTCILHQTRYHRHMQLRKPIGNLVSGGKPVDIINFLAKRGFVSSGYAVVSVDVRGTGASSGRWPYAWSEQERQDSLEVLDWIQRQPWSNGKVVTYGISYDGTAALWTSAMGHPSVVGCVARYPFWDVYGDIAMVNGVPMRSFFEQWMALNRALDANKLSMLPGAGGLFAPLVVKGVSVPQEVERSSPEAYQSLRLAQGAAEAVARPDDVILMSEDGVEVTSVPPGATSPGAATASAAEVDQRARLKRIESKSRVKSAVKEHQSWDLLSDLAEVRYIDQRGPDAGVSVQDITCARMCEDLVRSGVSLYVESGWLDSTTYGALAIYHHCCENPASQARLHKLVIGPWNHSGKPVACRPTPNGGSYDASKPSGFSSGFMSTPRGLEASNQLSQFAHIRDIVQFVHDCLDPQDRPVPVQQPKAEGSSPADLVSPRRRSLAKALTERLHLGRGK